VYNKKASNGLYDHIQYNVSSTKLIKNDIINHFESYPLMSYKSGVYQIWAELIMTLSEEVPEKRNNKAINLINEIKNLNSQ
jgi:hypothetical protein